MAENLSWSGPFNIKDPIPNYLRAKPGIYKIDNESETIYVGQSKTSAHKRAKDHFRGQGDSTGRWIIEHFDMLHLKMWVARIDNSCIIDLLEELLIKKLNPRANVNLTNNL